jgi:stage V sporulation protein SpoVS
MQALEQSVNQAVKAIAILGLSCAKRVDRFVSGLVDVKMKTMRKLQ